MAMTATQPVTDRLRQYVQVREQLEAGQSLAGKKWGARPMKQAALQLYPAARLRELRARIDASPDPGIVPLGIKRIKERLLPDVHMISYCPLDRLRPLLQSAICGSLDLLRLETDLAALGSNVGELYGLAVVEVAEQKIPGVFGPNDDPDGHDRHLAARTTQLAALVEDLRANPGGPDDIVFAHATVNGTTRRLAFHKIDGIDTQVPFGDAQTLCDWAWQHRGQF